MSIPNALFGCWIMKRKQLGFSLLLFHYAYACMFNDSVFGCHGKMMERDLCSKTGDSCWWGFFISLESFFLYCNCWDPMTVRLQMKGEWFERWSLVHIL